MEQINQVDERKDEAQTDRLARFSRTVRLVGEDALNRLSKAHVAVFGLGGVGSYAVEALSRAGVGALTLVDGDVVEISNLNRQLVATMDTLGLSKADVAFARVRSINPECRVDARTLFFDASTMASFDFASFDYVLDAIDTVASKILLIECAQRAGTPILSAMGAGNKLDPMAFEVADIEKTSVCPLARVMRRELKARGLTAQVVYSKEPARPVDGRTPGSISFVPGAAGLLMAGTVVKALSGIE